MQNPDFWVRFNDRGKHNDSELYVFLSYTSRDLEVQLVQDFVDEYCYGLWEWGHKNGIHIFYDHFSLPRRKYKDAELALRLASAINLSDLMTTLISPEYVHSDWCRFEWGAQYVRTSRPPVESDDGSPPQTHVIYWKPDIWNESPDEIFYRGFQEFHVSDVTAAYDNPFLVPQAISRCIYESASIISRMYPDKTNWRMPSVR